MIPCTAIESIRQQYAVSDVLYWLDRAKRANAVVIGEEIIDEYIYVQPLFKSSKDNIIGYQPVGRQIWDGGASIVAEDLRQFASSVKRMSNGPPVRKLRYVDNSFKQKLFSVIEQPTVIPLGGLSHEVTDAELIVVADYGHGLINRAGAHRIATVPGVTPGPGPSFLAITVQSNSANWGFNQLTKWPHANYIVVDRNELQLACADRDTEIVELADRMRRNMNADYFAVTLGHQGCLVLGKDSQHYFPVLSDSVVDRMGAGDAFLAATAPLAWAGAPPEIIALVGNIAGAIKVGKLGNQPIMRSEVDAWLHKTLD